MILIVFGDRNDDYFLLDWSESQAYKLNHKHPIYFVGNQEMKNKLSLLVLSLSLLGSGSAFADTTMEDDTAYDADTSELHLEMSAGELQEVKEICMSIAEDSGLVGAEHTQYIDECIATETMVADDPEASMEIMNDMNYMDDTESSDELPLDDMSTDS